MSLLSSSNSVNYVKATSISSHSWSWTSHSWSWSSHSWSWTTGYGWNNYYNGYYNNGGYYPYQNYCNPYYYPSYYCNSPYPSYSPYQVQTATTTLTQQSYVTQVVTSTDSIMVPVSFTSIMMVTTTDNSAITFYGLIIAALLILVGLFAFMSLFLLSKNKTTPAAQTHVASN